MKKPLCGKIILLFYVLIPIFHLLFRGKKITRFRIIFLVAFDFRGGLIFNILEWPGRGGDKIQYIDFQLFESKKENI